MIFMILQFTVNMIIMMSLQIINMSSTVNRNTFL